MEIEECPYRAEYAKSSRSKCKGCKEGIEKDHLRLAVMIQVRQYITYIIQKHNLSRYLLFKLCFFSP